MIIYKVTNKINGKWYIGKDSKNIPGYLGSGIVIKQAIKKYGRENFTKEILEVCENLAALNERESFWIEHTNAIDDENSYNLAKGGQGGNLSKFRINKRKSQVVSEKTRMKISLANKGKLKGKFNSNKESIIESNKKRKGTTYNGKRIVLKRVVDGELFSFKSITDAINFLKISTDESVYSTKLLNDKFKNFKLIKSDTVI